MITASMLRGQNPEVAIWEVDLDLGHLNKVSKQHAAVLYNFEDQQFDLVCLSEDYPVKVTPYGKQQMRELTNDDAPYKLQSKDKI